VRVFFDNTRSALSLHHGVGNVGTHFFLALKRHGRDVDPVFLYRRGAGPPAQNLVALRALGCTPLRAYHPYLSLDLPLRGRILHSSYHKLPSLPFRTRILHVHDVWTLRPNPYQSSAFQEARADKLRRVLERADLYTVLTESLRDEMVSQLGVEADRIVVTGYGCPRSLEGDPPRLPSAGAELESAGPYALIVARLEARKNYEHVTRAVAAVPGLRLVVVGIPGFEGERLAQESFRALREQGRLTWHRQVSPAALAQLYRGALAYVCPSWEEGFGITLLEAMSYGTPVITSDRSANREVVAGGGTLVDPADWEASAECLGALLADPDVREEHSRRARARAAEFRWEDVAARLEDLYRSVA
jgi:glycosyltransferase involved in cell wall biosynthesis